MAKVVDVSRHAAATALFDWARRMIGTYGLRKDRLGELALAFYQVESDIAALNSLKSKIYEEARRNGIPTAYVKLEAARIKEARNAEARARVTDDDLFQMYQRFLARLRPISGGDGKERVYFLYAPVAKRIKIGFTTRIEDRIRTLSAAAGEPLSLLGSTLGGRELELFLHTTFWDLRLHGEWFKDDPRIREYVASLNQEAA